MDIDTVFTTPGSVYAGTLSEEEQAARLHIEFHFNFEKRMH